MVVGTQTMLYILFVYLLLFFADAAENYFDGKGNKKNYIHVDQRGVWYQTLVHAL